MNFVLGAVDYVGRAVLHSVEEAGRIFQLFLSVLAWLVRPPLRLRPIFKQMEFVGVRSIFVVVLTGTFTGMVLALQTYHGFRMFSAESMVGATVALSMTRELGPVLTALMVTARAGSAMAAELGTMRVTEQIDALYVMAANPVKYLIVPRMVASVVMLPFLTIVSDFVGVVGGYFVGVHLLRINSGIFMKNITKIVELDDIFNGLIKAAFFGLILSLIGCYKGFNTTGGAEGVGRATTEAVVLASVMILISDYFLTALMF
ncbi:MAG TPA: ABC transporter permease [Syntrophales bacterium]|nr:ABC transporter permease [Syntrophales bacterium]HOM07480.1 ABC transporter permease [Syntrophales bacterium]HOO00015.1 ABC transporter permease [Syntrophales bacterium]HPC00871.1 ABC transporter permease [Syntrophales bacterium]HPQ07099.1 ABC transporter permease [Syntrophales bacterium]